ncbi:MAG TPA: nucleoside 2-deoxyribosyltransferase [Longilinea sp.]|nr:nucleoside 2-deoxyribosyltransferase [Longilinea sp.]
MNIYFSCSVTGGRADQQVYEAIVEHLLAGGHEVPTAHLSDSNIIALEAMVEPQDVYMRDVAWVKGCDALIAEVGTPSHGVGYEIALALSLGKPVFCCYHKSRRVSKMITGNTHSTLTVSKYETTEEAVALVDEFLKSL